MVKQKTTDSVTDWLEEGELVAAARQTKAETTTEIVVAPALPIIETSPMQMAEGDVSVASNDVAVTHEEAANWFWNLLAQAGFEIY